MKKGLNITDLVDYCYSSIVPASENQLGAEYEIICLEKENFSRLDYQGSPGIKELLESVAEQPGFRRTEEDGLLTGLKHDDFTITINSKPRHAITSAVKAISDTRKPIFRIKLTAFMYHLLYR